MPAKKSTKFPTIPILLALIGLLIILFFYKEKLFSPKQTTQAGPLKCPKEYTLYKDKDFVFCYPEFLGQVHRKTIYEETNPNVPLLSHHPAYEKLTFSSYPASYDPQEAIPNINIFNVQEVKDFKFESFTAYSESAENLEKLLEQKNEVDLVRQSNLPLFPPVIMAGQVFHARQKFLKGPQFNGITFITAFAQNIYLTNNSLVYTGKVADKIISAQFPLYVFFKAEYEQKINDAFPNDPEGTVAIKLLTEYGKKVVERQNTEDVSPHPEVMDKIFESFRLL